MFKEIKISSKAVYVSSVVQNQSRQARIHTGFTETGQNFHNKKVDMYIFLINVICKLNRENSFDICFLNILFCQSPEIDKGNRHVLASQTDISSQ